MADPYADRTDLTPSESPAPDGALAGVVAAAGGRVLATLAGAAAEPGDARFGAVLLAGDGLLPPLARISPELAAAILAADDDGEPPLDDAAVAAARALLRAGKPLFLLKEGSVAGPGGAEGVVIADPELTAEALEAALGGGIEWEADPDFAYEVAAAVPGIEGPAADAFVPRILYAAADRVYEHAQLVAATKHRRHAALERAGVVDAGLHAAIGWPIEKTGQDWKDG